MNILAVNTSGLTTNLALLNNEKIVFERSIKSDLNESEKLLPELREILKSAELSWEQIDKIVCLNGPGPFTALRVSIAVCNAIAYSTGAKIIPLSIHKYWEKRIQGDSDCEIILSAGRNRVYYNNNLISPEEFLDICDKNLKYSGELREDHLQKLIEAGINWIEEKNLKSFAETILTLAKNNFEGLAQTNIIEPLYYAPPHITKSTKSYK